MAGNLDPDKEVLAETTLLNPGGAGTCDRGFVVENPKSETAELKVILGIEDYINERLEPNKKRAYSLGGSILVARSHGRQVEFDDMAAVINMNSNAKPLLRCLNLKPYPLREEDGLGTFR